MATRSSAEISWSAPPFRWKDTTVAQRRTLVAAGLGWMLDAFDVMLYSIVLATLMRELGMGKATAGFLNTLTLIASAIGSLGFGLLADRLGRRKMLSMSILTYSIFTFACGFSTSITMLAVFRFLLGLGMGGEWNSGATLVAETWPSAWRGRAMGIVQSSWAIGYALAAMGLLCWRVPCNRDFLDSARRAGTRLVDPSARESALGDTEGVALATRRSAAHLTSQYEYVWNVCLVGFVYLDPGLPCIAYIERRPKLQSTWFHCIPDSSQPVRDAAGLSALWRTGR